MLNLDLPAALTRSPDFHFSLSGELECYAVTNARLASSRRSSLQVCLHSVY